MRPGRHQAAHKRRKIPDFAETAGGLKKEALPEGGNRREGLQETKCYERNRNVTT
jgi:hypothetical protein